MRQSKAHIYFRYVHDYNTGYVGKTNNIKKDTPPTTPQSKPRHEQHAAADVAPTFCFHHGTYGPHRGRVLIRLCRAAGADKGRASKAPRAGPVQLCGQKGSILEDRKWQTALRVAVSGMVVAGET